MSKTYLLVLLIGVAVLLTTPSLADHHEPPKHERKPPIHKPPSKQKKPLPMDLDGEPPKGKGEKPPPKNKPPRCRGHDLMEKVEDSYKPPKGKGKGKKPPHYPEHRLMEEVEDSYKPPKGKGEKPPHDPEHRFIEEEVEDSHKPPKGKGKKPPPKHASMGTSTNDDPNHFEIPVESSTEASVADEPHVTPSSNVASSPVRQAGSERRERPVPLEIVNLEELLTRSRSNEIIVMITTQVGLGLLTFGSKGSDSLSRNAEILLYSAEACNVIGFAFGLIGISRSNSPNPGGVSRIMVVIGYLAAAMGFIAVMGMLLPDKFMLWITSIACLACFAAFAYAFLKRQNI